MKTEHPSLKTAQGQEIVLRSMQAQGRLQGLLLEMTLKQVFRNDTRKNMEVVYTFPLAWGAVLLGMDVTLGGKRMSAQVMARQEAREHYEDAVQKGDAPVMVEQSQAGVFSAMLGSLKPGEEAQIELSYAQLLAYEQGRIRVVVPTTLAPRYGDAQGEGGLQADQAAAPDLLAEHPFTLSVTLVGALAQARITSPSHTVAQQRLEEGVCVSLARGAWLDRDFVLVLEGLQRTSFALAGPDERSGPGHTALISSHCPDLPPAEPAPLRLKLLVDCSGSMSGDSMAQAKAALRVLASGLSASDTVSFSRFGSAPRRVLKAGSCGWWHTKALKAAIDQTQADLGGTELAAALKDTFELPMESRASDQQFDVLLITDGEVWNAQELVDLAQRSGHRIYALGVGSAPAESLLREMALATGGACEFASPNEDMAGAMARLLTRIQQAQAVRAELDLPLAPLWSSMLPQRLVPGETVHMHFRLGARLEQAPRLRIDPVPGQTTELTWIDGDLVARLVAARQIAACADADEARHIAERYALVTPQTNLLLVFERSEADKTDGMPDLHQVRPMLAAGWGGTGAAGHGPLMQVVAMAREPDYGNMTVPSVWRTNRTQSADLVDRLSAASVDDFEIPAFLRKQSDEPLAGAPRKPARAAQTTLESFVRAFNTAARQGQPFRQTLRAVMDLPLDHSVTQAILRAANSVGGPVHAWACFLLWLHRHMAPNQGLSQEALALVQTMVQKIAPSAVEAADRVFDARVDLLALQP